MMSPNCGLFIQTPNSINESSEMWEMVPIPDERIPRNKYESRYIVCGAIIAICIRSTLPEDISFPNLVWNYLATGELKIEDIYSIDHSFEQQIHSLEDALSLSALHQLTAADFTEKFSNQFFVIKNITGKEVPLSARGASTLVTLSNCDLFITQAKEFRINELLKGLKPMRKGLWENLNLSQPVFVDGRLLQYLTCGTKEFSANQFKAVLYFEGITSVQKNYLLRVIDEFTPEQRSDLLKFTTGRVRLPTDSDFVIRVNSAGNKDCLPHAGTCYNQLLLPNYSSYEIAFQMIKVAVELTGTFENK